MRWFQKDILNRVQISGIRRLGYHSHQVEGDREAFNLENYSGQGNKTFTDFGHINLSGRKVGGIVNFQATIADSRIRDPQTERFSIDIDRGPTKINLGDIQGSLINTNRFAAFSKSMKGGMLEYRTKRYTVKGIYSDAKGSARTVSLQGANSTGPYYLGASQLVNGSEQIQVDGRDQKLGLDYVINYEIGSITFIRIIPPSSTIVATFEILGINAQRGTVQGIGASYEFGRAGRLSATVIEQKSRAGGSLSSRVELFQGFGPPSTPYTLQFEPLGSFPIIIRLDGVVQTQGVDYVFDQLNPAVFYFLRFVPNTSTIEVVYTPKPTNTVDGDRRVVGFDYRIPLGRGFQDGYLQYQQASGELRSPVTPLSGVARGVDGQIKLKNFDIRGSLRDIPEDFIGIETRGFNRNEKASDLAVDYHAKNWTSGLQYQNSSIAVRQTSGSGAITFNRARMATVQSHLTYTGKGGPWRLEHRRLRGRQANDDSSLDVTSLDTTRTFGRLNTKWSLEHQEGEGLISTSTSTERGNMSLDGLRFSGAYNAGAQWTVAGKLGLSQVEALGKSGSGVDVAADLGWRPSERFRAAVSYANSDSGELATLGTFQSGLGFGYGGNGFSGGVSGAGGINSGNTARLMQLTTEYDFGRGLIVNARASRIRNTGSVTSNTETDSLGLDVVWEPRNDLGFSLGYDSYQTRFIGNTNRSNTQNLGGTMSWTPRGPWSITGNLSLLLAGGNTSTQQDSWTLDGAVGYRLAKRQRLFANFSKGRSTGYQPQNLTFASVGYEYQIWRQLSLNATYRFREVLSLDPFNTSGAYRSKGLDIELGFNFGR